MRDKLGKYFKDEKGEIFQLIGYCQHPTATFQNVKTKQRIGGAVHSPNVTQFTYIESSEAQNALKNVLESNQNVDVRFVKPACPSKFTHDELRFHMTMTQLMEIAKNNDIDITKVLTGGTRDKRRAADLIWNTLLERHSHAPRSEG